MGDRIDIHDYSRKLTTALQRVRESPLSARNRELILAFDRATSLLEGLSTARRARVLGFLRQLASWLGKELDRATREDLQALVEKLGTRGYSVWTIHSYKATLKKFYKWLHFGDKYAHTTEFPESVRWIRVHVRKREQPTIRRSDLILPAEVEASLRVAKTVMRRALIAMAWELGARVGEIGSLTVGAASRAEHGFRVDLSGKTGGRTCLIVESAPYLTMWLSVHPAKDDPKAPLWTVKERRPLAYRQLAKLIKGAFTEAGVVRRVHPHLFRHSRATYVLAKGIMNETQAKQYFGWVPDSKMIATYAHLVSEDTDKAILQMHGLEPRKADPVPNSPRPCRFCEELNVPAADYCMKCANPLDLRIAMRAQEQRRQADDVLAAVLTENPEAVRALARRLSELGLVEKVLKL